ncbi:hypothetical protein [Aromatoleum diolicum]|uniref:Uncharacterized protein n=1 Tax=Aromatoleum diolicum TaxID=75796 RepID=A0ABX1QC56_9RHOO|nr:hypothetical protein [Aromatoleum diolicum]NMG75057.1 hypothetical protein [Aromatoleum diolicum]
METAAHSGKHATWLELAVAPEWRRNKCKIRVHALGQREGGCYAISMDNRWLCVGSGGLTVFHGLSAALRFLKLLRIDNFEPGEAADVGSVCSGERYCLCEDKGRGLLACDCATCRCCTTH